MSFELSRLRSVLTSTGRARSSRTDPLARTCCGCVFAGADRDGRDHRASDHAGDADSPEGETERPELRQAGKREEAVAPRGLDDGNPLDELELVGEHAPGPEDQRLHGREGQAELGSDLRIRLPLYLPQQDHFPLRVGQAAERGMDVGGRGTFRIVEGEEELGVCFELDFLRPLGAEASPPADDVSRDGVEPSARLLRPVAAPQGAERVQKRRLGDILRLVGIAQLAEHRAVDLAPVPPVDPFEGAIGIHESFMPPKLPSQAC